MAGADASGIPVPGLAGAGIPQAAPESFSAEKERAEQSDETDATFRDLLARVNLAQARLRFLADVLQAEFNSVESAITSLEKVEDQARSLSDDTARLAADQESLRRSLETEQQTLTNGAETLDLVKKRFAADHKTINELLDDAAEKTTTLAKRLE